MAGARQALANEVDLFGRVCRFNQGLRAQAEAEARHLFRFRASRALQADVAPRAISIYERLGTQSSMSTNRSVARS